MEKLDKKTSFKSKLLDNIGLGITIIYLIGFLFCILILPSLKLGFPDGLIVTITFIAFIAYLAWLIK